MRLTKDGQLVVIHDDTLLRTCGVDLAVETMDYKDLPPFKEEYMSFGNGLMKSEVNRIPRLDDVFREFPDKLMNI